MTRFKYHGTNRRFFEQVVQRYTSYRQLNGDPVFMGEFAPARGWGSRRSVEYESSLVLLVIDTERLTVPIRIERGYPVVDIVDVGSFIAVPDHDGLEKTVKIIENTLAKTPKDAGREDFGWYWVGPRAA